jgi:hypothetical protein
MPTTTRIETGFIMAGADEKFQRLVACPFLYFCARKVEGMPSFNHNYRDVADSLRKWLGGVRVDSGALRQVGVELWGCGL